LYDIFQALESDSESENEQPCDNSFVNIGNDDTSRKSDDLTAAKPHDFRQHTKSHYFDFIGKMSMHSLKYFKRVQYEKISQFLLKILNDDTNVFGFLIKKYKEYFLELYFDRLLNKTQQNEKISEDNEKEEDENHLSHALMDIKLFTKTMANCIFLFFDLEEFKRKTKNYLFIKDNILNIVVSVVVKEKVLQSLLKAQQIIDEGFNKKLKEKIIYYSNFPPEKFEVPPKFCLNNKTSEYIKHIKGMNRELEMNNYVPYAKTIKKLEEIVNFDNPLSKINLIMNVAETMQREIIEFYEIQGVNYSEKIGGDELLTVFIYIISHLKINSFDSELKITNNFLSSTLINSIAGYYITTMMIACKYLADFNSESFILRKER
jgi:hypothetical protein